MPLEAASADLQKEVNILKDCHSEFVVAYKGTFEKDDKIWIAMEYCGGGSLCDLISICERVLTEEQVTHTYPSTTA
jgi:serine/threonine protein kinase